MKSDSPSRPLYPEAQLMLVGWAIVVVTVAFYGGLVWLALSGSVNLASAAPLFAVWLVFLALVALQVYRLEKTMWIWMSIAIFGSPLSQFVVCWKMFFDTRLTCQIQIEEANSKR